MVNAPNPRYTRPILLTSSMLVLCLWAVTALASQLEITVSGVEDPLLANVLARTQSFQISGNARLSRRRLARLSEDAERRAGLALRPYGYYHPVITSTLQSTSDENWAIHLDIDKGPPVIVSDYRVEITGPGKSDRGLLEWKNLWPLTPGAVLDQSAWEEQKTKALELAEEHGYLGAGFSEQVIRLDLEQNRASLLLVLDTGEQAVMGTIAFNQDQVNPVVLDSLPRFTRSQPYDAWLLEQFRLDLWRTGYFDNIEVLEERRMEESPPLVNLVVNMEPRKLNTYQGSLGYGTDTGVRLQGLWNRHLLSKRGDSLDVGIGWQQQYNEKSLRTNYRLPRKVQGRQYWTAELLYKTENQEFTVYPNGDPGNLVTLARGNVDNYSFKPGLLKIRDLKRGSQQIFETWYVQFLRETTRFSPSDQSPVQLPGSGLITNDIEFLGQNSNSASIGVSWDWPVIRGNGFETVGHSHQARIFTSNTVWGSDLDFTQAYVASRWNTIWKDRWKFLLRGEIGYSDAQVRERFVETGGEVIELSVTELPFAYRFKAGGSQSVRGYGFENLSNNNIGSNNIVTASAELELRVAEDWSAAVFLDVGNAFNDWNSVSLKKGAGVGVRWYSIAGAIRLDFAQAIDEPGKPWRIHFTIGSPLL